MKQLKVFLAGKVDPSSKHASPFWRDELIWQINKTLKNYRVLDSSLTQHRNRFVLDNNLHTNTLFSQSCFYIQHSDLLVVNLTDDISVGGSQEIFVAKSFGVPVVGVAPRGGKFNKLTYVLGGKTYWNWTHPFVDSLCDLVVQDIDELVAVIDDFECIPNGGLGSISAAIQYYQRAASSQDDTVTNILSFNHHPEYLDDATPKLRFYFAGKMSKAAGFSESSWRDQCARTISGQSRFQSVNLDFLAPTNQAITENDGKLIFGRDAYLIRSSDVVVVNLSDDISVGGAVEMMLAKLYHRPLIGIARQNGKFVQEEKDLFGRQVSGYINPFVAATCDWLVHDPSELPRVVDQLFAHPVKSSRIIPTAAEWYKKNLFRTDKGARTLFAVA